jgi:outer membrane protein TolC
MLVFMVCLLWAAGCFRNAGIGGTGEIVVPTERWQQIQPFDAGTVSLPPPASQPVKIARPTTVQLNIERARQLALQNNLDLHVDLINPTLAKETLSQAEAQFESTFFGDAGYVDTHQDTYSSLLNSRSEVVNGDIGVNVPLQTGGTATLELPFNRYQSNNSFDILNPAYESDLQASFSIPVLRGAGVFYNTQQIRVAFYEFQASLATAKLQVTQVLRDVDTAYWLLYAARQELIVQQKNLDLSHTQADRARRQVAAQTAAQVEIVRADSNVAAAVEQVIAAQNDVLTHQRDLKRVMNDPEIGIESDTSLIPSTLPDATEYRLDPEKLVSVAMHDRMDLLATELRIAEEASNVKIAHSDLLPLVTLSYQYDQNGLGPSFGSSYQQLGEGKFANHTVGVHVEIPIGNDVAKSELRAALDRRLLQLSTKQLQQASIKEAVLNDLDTLNLTWQQILAARQRVALDNRLVAAEVRQFELGLRTSTDVAIAQNELASARSAEVTALTQYQVAQVDIAYDTGSILGSNRVVWQPIAAGSKE